MGKTDRIERREYWTGQVRQWRESGLTQREYCKREGTSIERFGAWKRRLDRENQSETRGLVAVPSKVVKDKRGRFYFSLFLGRPLAPTTSFTL